METLYIEPYKEQDFPRLVNPSETLSSKLSTSKFNKINSPPTSVHDRLYKDSIIRQQTKTHKNSQKLSNKIEGKPRKGIENILLQKGKVLEEKKERVKEKWEWIRKQNFRYAPEINELSKKLAYISYAKKGHWELPRCSSRSSSNDALKMKNLTERNDNGGMKKYPGLNINIADLQKFELPYKSLTSRSTQRNFEIQPDWNEENGLTERKIPKSSNNDKEKQISTTKPSTLIKKSIEDNSSRPSSKMSFTHEQCMVSPKSQNKRKKSYENIKISNKDEYILNLLSQRSRTNTPSNKNTPSLEPKKSSNPQTPRHFPSKSEITIDKPPSRIVADSALPLELAHHYRELIKRRCEEDNNFLISKRK
ncbi:unnamed protein product [Blepharisma stoltei]|uniref:Nuclear protein MDM1 n=1 Tax=Blepharisma stoltei TaxID=1481888 RepID=A0AAU9J1S2_9CILI|nr:unnamed protein product [Blepharisma stoltei]